VNFLSDDQREAICRLNYWMAAPHLTEGDHPQFSHWHHRRVRSASKPAAGWDSGTQSSVESL
jgi:hypothetical protein